MVGKAIKERFTNHKIICPKKYELNVSNIRQVFKQKNIEAIIHTAAETDHEYCEENSSQAYYINTIGTAHMMRLAKSLDIPIVYLAAGSIFDGKKGKPYTTKDTPNPLNHYNMSKYYGELILKGYPKHYIVRAGWMFGGGRDTDKKFVNKIIRKIELGVDEVKVCDDCVGSPIYTNDLADCIKQLVEFKHGYGTYNLVNDGPASRYEFAQEIFKNLRRNGWERELKRCKLTSCKIDDLKEEFPCKRTNYEVLESSLTLRHWKKALEEYIHAHYRH